MNQAFLRLRKSVPIENRNKRVSKVKTLQRAIDYIRKLERILEQDEQQQEEQTTGAAQATTSGKNQTRPAQSGCGKQPKRSRTDNGEQASARQANQRKARKALKTSEPDSTCEQPDAGQAQTFVAESPRPASFQLAPAYYGCPNSTPQSLAYCEPGRAPFQAPTYYRSPQGQTDAGYLLAGNQRMAAQQQAGFNPYRLDSLATGSPHNRHEPQLTSNYGARPGWTSLQSPSNSSPSNSSSLGVCESPSSSSSSSAGLGCRTSVGGHHQQQVNRYLSYAGHLSNNSTLDERLAYSHQHQHQHQPQHQQHQHQFGPVHHQQHHQLHASGPNLQQQQSGGECKTGSSESDNESLLRHQQVSSSTLHPQVRPPLLLLNSNNAEQQINNTLTVNATPPASAADDGNLHYQLELQLQLQQHPLPLPHHNQNPHPHPASASVPPPPPPPPHQLQHSAQHQHQHQHQYQPQPHQQSFSINNQQQSNSNNNNMSHSSQQMLIGQQIIDDGAYE